LQNKDSPKYHKGSHGNRFVMAAFVFTGMAHVGTLRANVFTDYRVVEIYYTNKMVIL
jgi:hypothetical protein